MCQEGFKSDSGESFLKRNRHLAGIEYAQNAIELIVTIADSQVCLHRHRIRRILVLRDLVEVQILVNFAAVLVDHADVGQVFGFGGDAA